MSCRYGAMLGFAVLAVVMVGCAGLHQPALEAAPAAVRGAAYAVQVYNVDDLGRVAVNGELVTATGFRGDSGWVDITQQLVTGTNLVRFTLENVGGGWTYGFKLRKDAAIVWEEEAGVANQTSAGPDKVGIMFDHTVEIVR